MNAVPEPPRRLEGRSLRAVLSLLLVLELASIAYSFVVFIPRESMEWNSIAVLVAFFIFVLTFSVVGVLLAVRVRSNPIGWIMFAAGFAFAAAGVSLGFAESAIDDGHTGTVVQWLAWASTWLWIVGTGFALPILILLFPDGRPPSPRWRPLLILTAVGIVGGVLATALSPFDASDTEFSGVPNPIALAEGSVVLDVLAAAGALIPIGAIGAVISLFFRFRRAAADQRQQLKWLSYAALLCIVALAGETIIFSVYGESELAIDIANTISAASIATLPIAIGIAILKYRLYDIDRIVNRTLVYGVLTALLAVIYLAFVVLLQRATDPFTADSDLAIAGSTLAVAAMFRPLRARLQVAIDRRFYRSRYDARRILVEFGGRLRDQVEIEAVEDEVIRAVDETMHPAHASLWLRSVSR